VTADPGQWPDTLAVLLLPLFFWGAVRFGPGGLSFGLLVCALGASWAAMANHRLFDQLPPAESLIALQMYLSLMAIPLLCLTALLEERRAAARAVAARLAFEEELSRLSASFVRLSSDQMATGFESCLQRVGRFLDVDRAVLMEVSPSGDHLVVRHQWNAEGVAPLTDRYSCKVFPWVLSRLLGGDPVIVQSIDDLPADSPADRQAFAQLGLQAAMVTPIVASGRVHGVLSLHVTRAPRVWPPEVRTQVPLLAEMLGHALVRQRTEDALRSSESMKSAILRSLSSHVAVLDRRGCVLAVNEGWRRSVGVMATGKPDRSVAEGQCYFAACRDAALGGYEPADLTLRGVQDVLDGRRDDFTTEYPYPSLTGLRWCAVAAVPLQRPDGGAVVSYTDITERKRGEIEVQRTRQELAQVTRLSTMGELTASLAHQLNQPLTGILSNAQAARRHLDLNPPNLAEVRDIVLDIIEDDRRAGDVIRRLRELLTTADSEPAIIDVNAVVRDVALLMSSDAIIRNVSVSFELAQGPAHVRGRRAELQQMLVHLLVNAMDAVAGVPVPERVVTVKTERADDDTVLLTVSDRGDGLAPGTEHQVFEPFFTTKASGIGMGLPITRSIVEAHDGRIWAANQPGRGAMFSVRLPLAAELVM
jgi:signal transduction histidine kinase